MLHMRTAENNPMQETHDHMMEIVETTFDRDDGSHNLDHA